MGQYQEALKTLCLQANYRLVQGRGNTQGDIAFLLGDPSEQDLCAGIAGTTFAARELDKVAKEAGLHSSTYWLDCLYPFDYYFIKNEQITATLEKLIERKPIFVIPCGKAAFAFLCPQCKNLPTAKTKKKAEEFSIMKWRGSFLTSPNLPWPHYVMPLYEPEHFLRDWPERSISVLLLSKLKEEWEYWKKHATLQPLPQRDIRVQPSDDEIIEQLSYWSKNRARLSSDIETIRDKITKKNYVYTIALAASPAFAISFCLWDIKIENRVKIFRLLNDLHKHNPLVGQNFRIFDSHWLGETLAFEINPFNVDDTMERHHTLHPEMEHKLQFLTLQYTREPYFKDEGKTFSAKNKYNLLKYGGKDACVTFEVFLEQEKEFIARKGTK